MSPFLFLFSRNFKIGFRIQDIMQDDMRPHSSLEQKRKRIWAKKKNIQTCEPSFFLFLKLIPPLSQAQAMGNFFDRRIQQFCAL